MTDRHLRYPIGDMDEALASPPPYAERLSHLRAFPNKLKTLVSDLTPAQLAATYRANSWTVRQLVHHCADSHAHALLRVKWALTEDVPEIRGYDEGPTATLPDYNLPIAVSLSQLRGIHTRLSHLLGQLSDEQCNRAYLHLGHQKQFTVDQTATMYAWHGRHHLAHIRLALASVGAGK